MMSYIFTFSFILLFVSSVTFAKYPITIESEHLKTNLNNQVLLLSEDVRITYKDTKLKTKDAQFNYKTHRLKLPNNVVVTNKNLTFSCNTLTLNQRTGKIIGSGNIQLHYPPYMGQSEKIEYINEKNVIILTGNPTFTHDTKKLSAKMLILNTETGKIESRGKTRYSSLPKPRS